MIKFFLKTVLVCAAVFTVSFTTNAQVTLINENFQSWAFDGYNGTNPGSTYNGTNTSDCEVSSASTSSFATVTKSLTVGAITYTLDSVGIAPLCYPRGGTSTTCAGTSAATAPPSPTSQPNAVSRGYVMLKGTPGSRLTTSVLTNVTDMDLGVSATGATSVGSPGGRAAQLQKSIDGGATYTNVQLLQSASCGAYGYMTTGILINEASVKIRIVGNPADAQRVRIHDLVVRSSSATGIRNTSWLESGISASVENNNITLKSDDISGTVDVISISGAAMGQKEIQKGGQASFVVPASGLYIIRVTSNDRVFTKKLVVN